MELPVLIVEQDPTTANDLRMILNDAGFIPTIMATFEEAKNCFELSSYKAVLLSHDGRNDEMLKFIEDMKGQLETKWLPLIVLSRKNYDVFRIDCFNNGADDFLLLPINPKELQTRVKGWINRIGSFEEMAFRDPLTKVYNRRYFDHQVMLELQRSQRHGYPISIAFIDADKFKAVNDTYGHHIGDLVLQGLSAALQNHVRSSDIVARYGGEEFVVLLPNANGEQASNKIHEILEHVRETAIAKDDSKEYYITFSCGVCEWKTGMSVADWIKTADEGVYDAKEQGRNRVILSNIKMPVDAEENKLISAAVIGSTNLSSILKRLTLSVPIEITEFKNPEEVDSVHADLCLIDVNKRLDWVEFEEFRKAKLSPDCKVLWISEGKSKDELLHGIVAGIDGYIRAPYSDLDIEIGIMQLLN